MFFSVEVSPLSSFLQLPILLCTAPRAVLASPSPDSLRTSEFSTATLSCVNSYGISSGIQATTAQLAIIFTVSRQQVAIALSSIGVGIAVAGPLWTKIHVFPVGLYEALPMGTKNPAGLTYCDTRAEVSYPIGALIQDANVKAYPDVQRKMVVLGALFALVGYLQPKPPRLRTGAGYLESSSKRASHKRRKQDG